MRYRLRTLLILLAVGPPIMSWLWWLDMAGFIIALAALFAAWGVATAVLAYFFNLAIEAKRSLDRANSNS
jgi:hypothetical protein